MIVVGAGRIGGALAARAAERGAPCTLVDRSSGWEALGGPPGDPVFLAVRADDLAGVLPRIPPHRRDDLVFAQNGFLREFLAANALSHATRGELYVAVAARGAPIVAATSIFCGPHGLGVARWFGHLGLVAREVDWARFGYYELEKTAWLVIFGLLCERHRCTVGEAATTHRAELALLAGELLRIGRAGVGVDVPADFLVNRLVAWAEAIPSWSAALRERPWRDGWFSATAARLRVPAPHFLALLAAP